MRPPEQDQCPLRDVHRKGEGREEIFGSEKSERATRFAPTQVRPDFLLFRLPVKSPN
jgi:hypothetical protein